MKALRELRGFILAKCNAEEQHEVRLYVAEHLDALASGFHVSPATITSALEAVQDDASLAIRMLETIRRTEALHRERRKTNRAKEAQASADAIGSVAQWDGEQVQVDILSLLSSALTRRNDLLVFSGDGFSVGVRQCVLFDLAKLKRRDLTAFVDGEGLHVCWSTGGLNFYPQSDRNAERVVVPLPAMPIVVAA